MPRYRLTVEYDGTAFHGFQAQDGVASVQGSIEKAIQGFSGQFARVHVAGRTDTGVHATGQVIHFDLDKDWKPDVVRDALNAHLVPEPVAMLDCVVADPEFHARFQATERRYLYRIFDRRAPAVLERGRVWWVKTPLDAEAMHQAAQRLIGTHDFTTFRHVHCQAKSPLRTLDEARVWRAEKEVHLVFAARSFLHNQVRSMVGSLAEVGTGRWSADDLSAALAAKDRKACGQVAPACGLYLTEVGYRPLAEEAHQPGADPVAADADGDREDGDE
jgi:tRNA pseudouridine38-40 synthase